MAVRLLRDPRVVQVLPEQSHQCGAHTNAHLPVWDLRTSVLLARGPAHPQAALPLGRQASQVPAVQPDVRPARRAEAAHPEKAQAHSHVSPTRVHPSDAVIAVGKLKAKERCCWFWTTGPKNPLENCGKVAKGCLQGGPSIGKLRWWFSPLAVCKVTLLFSSTVSERVYASLRADPTNWVKFSDRPGMRWRANYRYVFLSPRISWFAFARSKLHLRLC